MKPSRRDSLCRSLVVLVLVGAVALFPGLAPVRAQETTEMGFEPPDTGFEPPDTESDVPDRSDLGNVAQAARGKYAEGNRNLTQAKKLQRKIGEADEADKKAKLTEKRDATFQTAVQCFTDAIGYSPKMAEAYAGLGETLREWGKLDQSLEVYAAAVRRFPEDLETFEGWAMTLMELNLLGNATTAYTSYVEANPDRAAILMEVMKDWLQRKQVDPGDLSAADVQRLADWIEQQEAS